MQSESEIGLLHIQGMCLGILVRNSHNKHGKRKEKKNKYCKNQESNM